MNFNRLIILIILAISTASQTALASYLDTPRFTKNDWKSFTFCQQSFVLGYIAYKEKDSKTALKHFSNCDGQYPLLQNYISDYIKKIQSGDYDFFYIEPKKEAENDIETYKKEIANEYISKAQKKELIHKLGKAYFNARRYVEAATYFRKSLDLGVENKNSYSYLAAAIARQDRNEEAVSVYREFMSAYPKESKNVLLKITYLLLEDGKFSEAKKELATIRNKYPHYKRDNVRWYLAWCEYKLKNYSNAAKILESLKKHKRDGWFERASYWEAKNLSGLGKTQEAKKIYQSIVDSDPLSYYSFLASKELKKSSTSFLPLASDKPKNDIFVLSSSEHLDRAAELDKLRIKELVANELLKMVEGKTKDVDWWLVYELAKNNDAWNVVFKVSKNKFSEFLSTDKIFPDEKIVEARKTWEGAFPRAYKNHVEELAYVKMVDPKLVWSMMREESTFRSNVVSRAGAIGLMQLMPATAKRVTLHPINDSDLVDPHLNIELGINYLGLLTKHFDGNPIFMIAAYNAGESAVERWIQKKLDTRIEEFIEEIPYKETRNYVKKVLRSYWIYSALYK